MPQIQAPDGTMIAFPDTMKDADIESAMGRLYPPTPGTEKTGLPPAPKPPLPGRLNPHFKIPGAIPEGVPISASPILPESAIIPSAAGYGVSKIGEHLGLPDWVNTAAGIGTGLLTGGIQAGAKKIFNMGGDARGALMDKAIQKIPYIGPLINYARNQAEPRPVYPTPGEPLPTIQEPMRPNPNIANRISFGGPIDTEGGPAFGRVGMSGAPPAPPRVPEPQSVPFQPNIVKPGIARTLRYTPGGGEPPTGGNPPSSTVGTQAEMMRQLRLRQQQNAVAPLVREGE